MNQTNGQDVKPIIAQVLQPQNNNVSNQQLVDFLPSLEDYTPTVSIFLRLKLLGLLF